MSRRDIVRTEQADEDLIALWQYLSDYDAADRLLDAIDQRCRQLAYQPFSGVARDDIGRGVRHLVAGRYLILYRVLEDVVEIIRVLDGRRDIGPKLVT